MKRRFSYHFRAFWVCLLAAAFCAGIFAGCSGDSGSGSSAAGSSSAVSDQISPGPASVSPTVSPKSSAKPTQTPQPTDAPDDNTGRIDTGLSADENIAAFLASDILKDADDEKKVALTADYLERLSENGLIAAGSVVSHPELSLVEYVQNDNCLCFVDFREQEYGTTSAGAAAFSKVSAATGAAAFNEAPLRSGMLRTAVRGKERAKVVLATALGDWAGGSLSYYRNMQKYFDSNPEIDGNVILASPENMRYHLGGMDMIILECHGGLYLLDGKTVCFMKLQSSHTDVMADPEYEDDITARRISKITYFNGESSYMATPYFFTHYYGDGGLADCIVHVGSCYGFGVSFDASGGNNYALSDAILECGALCVLGHDNSVFTEYDNAIVSTILECLANEYTIGDALDYAAALHGGSDVDYMLNKYPDGSMEKECASHVPAHTELRYDRSALLFRQEEDPPAPEVTPETPPVTPEIPSPDPGTPLPEPGTPSPAPETGWAAAYAAILRTHPESAQFALCYIDYDLIPELFIADDGTHVDTVSAYTWKNGQASLLSSDLGSFGIVRVDPYENVIVSDVEYFGNAYTSVYEIRETVLIETLSLFTNESSTEPGIDVEYQVNGIPVAREEYGRYAIGLADRHLTSIGYGAGYSNSVSNITAFESDPYSFFLVMG